MANAGGRFQTAWGWVTVASVGAVRLGVGAALVLLVWGIVDQARDYLSLHSDDLRDLKRAAVLDSFDSQFQMRLGRKQLEVFFQAEEGIRGLTVTGVQTCALPI